jgi:hypothetical protein
MTKVFDVGRHENVRLPLPAGDCVSSRPASHRLLRLVPAARGRGQEFLSFAGNLHA